MKKRLYPLMLAATLAGGCAWAQAPQEKTLGFMGKNCEFKITPKEAYPVRTDSEDVDPLYDGKSSILFVYPKELPTDYNGCQTMWDQDGFKRMIFEFEHGVPVAVNYLITSCKIWNDGESWDRESAPCINRAKVDAIVKKFREARPLNEKIPQEGDPRGKDYMAQAKPSAIPKGRENCALPAPPKDAVVEPVHSMFVFVYPKTMSDNYTGCQTFWIESGDKMFSTYFDNGIPVIHETYRQGRLLKSCEIKENEGIEDKDGFACPSRSSEINTAKAYSNYSLSDIKVPPNRDPRR